MRTTPLWRPSAGADTHMDRFRRRAENVSELALPNYDALHRWSIDKPGEFWKLVAEYTGVVFQQPPTGPIFDIAPKSDITKSGKKNTDSSFLSARWFGGAALNYAENILHANDLGGGLGSELGGILGGNEEPAIISYLESGTRTQINRTELRRRVAGCAALFRELGVTKGDRVAGWLPNLIDAVVAMLATSSLGGVWSSCSPDFGAEGALDRFGQIEPRLLIACDGYTYGGKTFDTRAKVTEVADQVPSINEVLWVEVIGSLDNRERKRDLNRLIDAREDLPLVFERCAFSDPLYILYSSGTTGMPKCIVHGIGGTLLQHLKEHQLHTDVHAGDRLFFFTTCGWMMWNWLVSGLASGATIILFDGSPFYPGPEVLLDLAQTERVSQFGASAKYVQALENEGMSPNTTHNLASMRAWLSTGSPLTQEGFHYIYSHVKEDVQLASISGGTDIVSCFVLGNPIAPVYSGEIQCRGLGMAVDVWDDSGLSVVGEKGELVCTHPFPSAPIGFWNDPNQQKFKAAYFERFHDVWAHGDFAEITDNGGIIIHGRSDAVLNPGGVRIGTAEIYRQVEQIPEVLESVCVGQDWQDDVRVVLFVVLRPGSTLTDQLQADIRSRVRANASPRHVPAKILAVTDIPRTMSGKIAELAVRDVIHGRIVKNTSALANPEVLDQFEKLEALTS